MKEKQFRLTIFVKVKPNGESEDTLKRRLALVASDAVNDGKITGNGPATLENWSCEVKKI